MSGKEAPELDGPDRETADRILGALSEADYQIRRVKRNLRAAVQAAIADHREMIIQSARPQKTSRIKGPVDYDKLAAMAKVHPLTYDIIKRETGLSDGGVAEVIDMLSLDCALWKPAKGIYELLPR
jgi:hypothetical protein